MTNQTEPANKGRGKITAVAFAVLLAALAVCVVLLLTKKDEQTHVPASSREATALDRGFVDESNADTIMSDMADKVAEGMFECRMTTTWTFQDADSEASNAYVANVESNRYTLYFDVYESSTNELLYSSPLLPVGTEIHGIKLDKKLPAGDHDGVVMYTLVNENNEEVSTVGFNITISINH